MTKNYSTLDTFLSPSSIAVVGASRDEHKLGTIVVRNILQGGFTGKVFPVNPQAEIILGLKVYPNYLELPEVPDLAIIALPASFVLVAVEEIAQKGTKNIVIFSAGFKEIGKEGAALEKKLASIAQKYSLAILGPNCLGFINPEKKLNATFGTADLTAGSVRFIAQSGALASSIFSWAHSADLHLGTCVTLGNKAVLNENHFLENWGHATSLPTEQERKHERSQGFSGLRPIGLYLESLSDGRKFIRLAQSITRHDPLFILKPGKSTAAQSAMRSHTGSVAGNDAVLDEALQEAGIIRCRGFEDFFDLSRLSAWEEAPRGPRVAVISNAGGPAVLTTDIIEQEGLQLASLSPRTLALLTTQLPSSASILNPIDVLGDAPPARYRSALEAMLQESTVDAVLVILTPQIMTEIEATAQVIADLTQKHQKPVLCAFMGGNEIEKGERVLNTFKIPSFRYPERAIWALGRLWWWQAWRTKKINFPPPTPELPRSTAPERHALHPFETEKILKKIGLKVPPAKACTTFAEARLFLKKNKLVVLKIASVRLLHKRDQGGVITGITTVNSLRHAWNELEKHVQNLHQNGDSQAIVQIQQQIPQGIEVIIGIKRDENFGLMIVFGAGGTLVELLPDHTLHLLPMNTHEVSAFITRSKVFSLLNGYRGGKVYAIKKLHTLITRLAQFMEHDGKNIAELEINPVIVTEHDAWAVDGKALLYD